MTFHSPHEAESSAAAQIPDVSSFSDVPLATDASPDGFALLGLIPELLRAVSDMGFTQPTEVQQKTIPLAMQSASAAQDDAARRTDLMVCSKTGSGKTAAFLLPTLQLLQQQYEQEQAAQRAAFEGSSTAAAEAGQPAPKRPRRKNPTHPRNFRPATPAALVLCPTRELAQQVASDAIDLVRHCRGVRIASVVGGIPYQVQIARLQNASLVVATPGRLLDLQRSGQIQLEQVRVLVLDEADRMLDLGFADDLAEVHRLTAQRVQTLMFSATFAPRVQQLAARVMHEPQRITIDSPQQKNDSIRQVMHWADDAQHKRQLLDHWLRDASLDQAIVFVSTQVECDALAGDLQQAGFDAVALHGALSQGLRNRRLTALRSGRVQILVATDVAARGLDVPTITHVFNYGLPMKAEDYTHRIGRTGRAGRTGLAVTFAEARDRRRIFDIESYNRQTLQSEVIAGLEPRLRVPSPWNPGGGKKGAGKAAGGRRHSGGGDLRSGKPHHAGEGAHSQRKERAEPFSGNGRVRRDGQGAFATAERRSATTGAFQKPQRHGKAQDAAARKPARGAGGFAGARPKAAFAGHPGAPARRSATRSR